jgi:hypothetical protein
MCVQEITVLEDLVTVLEPLYKMTSVFSGRNYVSLSLVFPMMMKTVSKVVKAKVQTDCGTMMKANIQNIIAVKCGKLVSKRAIMACLLDPRFKTLRKCRATQLEMDSAVADLKDLYIAEQVCLCPQCDCAISVSNLASLVSRYDPRTHSGGYDLRGTSD